MLVAFQLPIGPEVSRQEDAVKFHLGHVKCATAMYAVTPLAAIRDNLLAALTHLSSVAVAEVERQLISGAS
jgi:ATP phosphoribosyltransferase regulatory subunit HisZ